MTEDDDRWDADRLHSDMDYMLDNGVAIGE